MDFAANCCHPISSSQKYESTASNVIPFIPQFCHDKRQNKGARDLKGQIRLPTTPERLEQDVPFPHGGPEGSLKLKNIQFANKMMINRKMALIRHLTLALVALLSLASPSPLKAATSDWQQAMGGKMRLISGGRQGNYLKAGLEIVLEDGWKTYWKVPGDAGIPPVLDFTGSKNTAVIDVKWPAPTRFGTKTQILGYKEAIIFPLLIRAADPKQPVTLVLQGQVGLCSDLCVPLATRLNLTIPAGGERDLGSEMLIDRDLALVPTAPRAGFGLIDITHEKGAGGKGDEALDRLVLTAQIPKGYGTPDLFVEGPENWLLPLPKSLDAKDHGGNEWRFELILDGLPKGGTTKGQSLTFTITNGDEAVAQSVLLEK
jgi:DsbC/DsbD-like thiol-disulfide interchange protein